MGGYTGKILRIDLTARKITTVPLDRKLARDYLSGRGLAGKMLLDELPEDVEPLSPANKIYIATGVLTGTKAPTSGRFMAVTKSPLNGAISSSNSGGHWGVQLKLAGYDMVILEGKAAEPVYISIKDDLVEIRDAVHIWGMDTRASIEAIKAEFGDEAGRVLAIGPAGENLSLLAMFLNDLNRVAGRSGVGAVMGSKNLKGLVVRGTGKVESAHPDQVKQVLRAALGKFKAKGITEEALGLEGDDLFAEEDKGAEDTASKDPCYRCPIICARHKKGPRSQDKGKKVKKSSFASDCGVSDFAAVQAANDLCDKFGLDSISVGSTIGTGMALVQHGYIQKEELAGTPLEFGHAEGMLAWISKIAYGEGLGAKMARGSYELAAGYGHPELAMTVKKLEVPAYDREDSKGQELELATSNRGGGHIREHGLSPEILAAALDIDVNSVAGKAELVKTLQDLTAVVDSIGLCLYTSAALGLSDYKALVNAVTGFDYTEEELLTCGERIWNVERLQAMQSEEDADEEEMWEDEWEWEAAGWEREEKPLPEHLLNVEIPVGLEREATFDLKELLKAYYRERGWDQKGTPTLGRLRDLGIMSMGDIAELYPLLEVD